MVVLYIRLYKHEAKFCTKLFSRSDLMDGLLLPVINVCSMYVVMYVCMYVHGIRVWVCIHVHCTCMYVCMYVCTCMHVCMYVGIHVCRPTYTYVGIRTLMYTNV